MTEPQAVVLNDEGRRHRTPLSPSSLDYSLCAHSAFIGFVLSNFCAAENIYSWVVRCFQVAASDGVQGGRCDQGQGKKMNIFVGNLSFSVADGDLRQAFEQYGQVSSANVILDKFTGKSRGFGFVEMPNAEEAKAAIAGLNNKDIMGRPVRVNEAQPRENRPRSDRPRGDRPPFRG
jgi:hypothetical protein